MRETSYQESEPRRSVMITCVTLMPNWVALKSEVASLRVIGDSPCMVASISYVFTPKPRRSGVCSGRGVGLECSSSAIDSCGKEICSQVDLLSRIPECEEERGEHNGVLCPLRGAHGCYDVPECSGRLWSCSHCHSRFYAAGCPGRGRVWSGLRRRPYRKASFHTIQSASLKIPASIFE